MISRRGSGVAALCMAFVLAAPAGIRRDPGDSRRSVAVESGSLAGTELASGVRAYLGVPFAAPPVRELRWRAPQPVTAVARHLSRRSHRAGVHPDAARARHQSLLRRGSDQRGLPVSERVGAAAPCRRAPLPVVVWIYGGGFTIGSASMANYSGESLARKVSSMSRLLPRRRARFPRASRAERRVAAARFGQLRFSRSDRRAAVDPAEHRAIRRRSAQRHDHGAVRGIDAVSVLQASPLAPRPVPSRGRDEWRRARSKHGPGATAERRRGMGARAAGDSEGAIARRDCDSCRRIASWRCRERPVATGRSSTAGCCRKIPCDLHRGQAERRAGADRLHARRGIRRVQSGHDAGRVSCAGRALRRAH